jgi:hypothetical protein
MDGSILEEGVLELLARVLTNLNATTGVERTSRLSGRVDNYCSDINRLAYLHHGIVVVYCKALMPLH